jgi:uncharacterized Ntn-hydrolase superfamily protein
MTFSIAGRCARTGMVGIVITTSSICVGARCPWVRARVGAVATQNVTDPALGPRGLDLMQEGLNAPAALERLMADAPFPEYRQVTMVDAHGRTAHWTGAKTLGTNAVATEHDCVAAGNLLSNPEVPRAMARTFAAEPGLHLAERLLRAIEEGIVAGGEAGPVKSAALLVADDQVWPLVNLRVDWDDDGPLLRLRQLWEAYEPQMKDYVARALDPQAAPAYGVPGDP